MITFSSGNATLYLGDKRVIAAYLGTARVYPNAFLKLSAVSLQFAAAGQPLELAITVEGGSRGPSRPCLPGSRHRRCRVQGQPQ